MIEKNIHTCIHVYRYIHMYVTVVAGCQVFAEGLQKHLTRVYSVRSSVLPDLRVLSQKMVDEKIKNNNRPELDHLQCRLQCIQRSVGKFQDHLIQHYLLPLSGEQENRQLQQNESHQRTPSEGNVTTPNFYPFSLRKIIIIVIIIFKRK